MKIDVVNAGQHTFTSAFKIEILGKEMAKKIILLSDGTGNSAGKVWRTNVWRIFQNLELKGSAQIAIYDDGVGTSSFKPLAILGGVFGLGLQRNVITLYKFLCRNYKQGDEIYAFGFSRGAFTIRVVIGLVLNQGLVEFENESQLDSKAEAALRAYSHEKYSRWNLQYPFRLIRIMIDSLSYTPKERTVDRIRFVGLWDTVAAYGLPIDEMTRGVDRWLWPLELPNRDFNSCIEMARHALAIDDERATFHPVLWNETSANTRPSGASRPTAPEHLLQVWFAGVHSNVGGGYPDDSLANVSLAWMMAEAKSAGLMFKDMPDAEPDALLSTDSAKDKDGRLYDSRSGLGGYYRYSPRKISDFYDAMEIMSPGGRKPIPKIHESVFARIRTGAHFYAPIGLPAEYEVVTTSDVIVRANPPPPIEVISTQIEPNDEDLAEGANNTRDRQAAQEAVWNLVWRKRAIYFLTVFTTGYLLAYPLFLDSYPFQQLRTPLRMIADTIRLVGAFLPSFTTRWIDAYARDPAWFLVWAFLVAFLTWVSAKLANLIRDRMRLLWIEFLPASNQPTTPALPRPQSPFKSALLLLIVLYLLLYPLFIRIGWLNWLLLPATSNEALLAYTAQPVRFTLAAFLLFCFLPNQIVQPLRTSLPYQAALTFFKNKAAPLVSAIGILYLVIAFGSHYHYNFRDGLGHFCIKNPDLDRHKTGFNEQHKAERDFDSSPDATKNQPNNLCVSTGVFLQTGKSYTVSVTRSAAEQSNPPQGHPWFFNRVTFMGGQPNSSLSALQLATMSTLYPFRHTFDRPWGNIILRVGSAGNEEDFLDREPPEQIDDPFVNDTAKPTPDSSQHFSETLKPKRDGELFIYLNKPVIGVWGYESLISDLIGDTGQAKIQIQEKSD